MNYIRSLMAKWKKGERGFTLVELLVVIAIIGVLATLVLLQLGTARGRARDTKRIADIAQIRGAIEQYYEDNTGTMPPTITATDIGKYFSSGTVPVDPLDGAAYSYCAVATTKEFQVAADLEFTAAALNSDLDWFTGDFTATIGTCLPAEAAAHELCAAGAADDDCVYDQGNINN